MDNASDVRLDRQPGSGTAPSATEPGASHVSRLTSKLLGSGLLPVAMVIAIVAIALIEPRFVSSANVINVLRQTSFLLIVALAQMTVLLAAEIDMSVGANMALTSVVSATVMTQPGLGGGLAAVVVGLLAGLATGLIVGAVNGLLVARFKVASFIITIAMTSVAFGGALMLSRGAPVTGLPRAFTRSLGSWSLWTIPAPVLVSALIALGMYVLLDRTVFGRHLYALGGSESAARVAGVPVFKTKVAAFILCGVLAALAGLLLTARVTSGEANLGSEFVILSIAAAVLGGTSFFGGEGRLPMVVLGSIFLVIVTNGMNLLRIESYSQNVVLGVLLGAAVILDKVRR